MSLRKRRGLEGGLKTVAPEASLRSLPPLGHPPGMPSVKFALDPGGPERLEVRWSGLWKDITVHLDGQEIGAIPSVIELHQGSSFTLPDGSVLTVMKRTKSLGNVELSVSRDGKPLPGTASDPALRLKWAAHLLYFIAFFTALWGLITLILRPFAFTPLSFGWLGLIGAAVYALLGFFTLRKSKSALIAAITLITLSTVFMFVHFMQSTGRTPVLLVLQLILVGPLLSGIKAINELKAGSSDAGTETPD
jgi:hypothetical protein